jgi:hypothetical protein
LKQLISGNDYINLWFTAANSDFLLPGEIIEENDLRIARVRLLYDRLSRSK